MRRAEKFVIYIRNVPKNTRSWTVRAIFRRVLGAGFGGRVGDGCLVLLTITTNTIQLFSAGFAFGRRSLFAPIQPAERHAGRRGTDCCHKPSDPPLKRKGCSKQAEGEETVFFARDKARSYSNTASAPTCSVCSFRNATADRMKSWPTPRDCGRHAKQAVFRSVSNQLTGKRGLNSCRENSA